MSNLDSLRVHVAEFGGDQATLAELYRQLLTDSLEHGATDIHVQFAASRVRVRYRVKGQLKLRCTLSLDTADGLFWAMKIHARMDIGERRRPQDGRGILQTSVGDRLIRVAIVPAAQGPSATLRWIEEDTRCRGLHEIGLLPAQLALVEKLLQQRLGFVVVGRWICGRRTVGHAMLLAAKQAGKSVLSLEWGVRRPIPGILQCELTPRSKKSQTQWIAAALRQCPDVLFIEYPGDYPSDPDTIGHVLAHARNNCLIVASMGRGFEDLVGFFE
jgi:type II secretory ATPase GspE/PulE/Tfp pilus assembly ATPase PilB-like protein